MRTLRRSFVHYSPTLTPVTIEPPIIQQEHRPVVQDDRLLVKHFTHHCRYVRETKQGGDQSPALFLYHESHQNYLISDRHMLVSVRPSVIDRVAHEYKPFAKLVPNLPAVGQVIQYTYDGNKEYDTNSFDTLLDLAEHERAAGLQLIPMYVAPFCFLQTDSAEPYTYGFATVVDYTPPELRQHLDIDRQRVSAVQSILLACFDPKFWKVSLVSPQHPNHHNHEARVIVFDANYALALGSIAPMHLTTLSQLSHYPNLILGEK